MRFEREISGGRAFMEFERKSCAIVLTKRGFSGRYKGKLVLPLLATEGPLIHDGAQNTLSTAQDARNSTNTGTTLAGPNGSGQFLAVTLSTAGTSTGTRTVQIASTLAGANFGAAGNQFYGILQNKPRGGEAADVGIFGISKMVAGSTAILPGTFLMMSSTNAGAMVPWVTGSGQKCGYSFENITAVGQVFTGMIGNLSMGST